MANTEHSQDRKARPVLQDQIQENLRALYDETLSEQLPDKLMDLLKKLEEQDGRK